MKASRDSFGEELVALGEKFPEIVVLDADLSKSTKSEKFGKKFPNRFFQMGIAEANMIGTAAGLALAGKTAFCCSFGAFLTGRYDQIRMSVSYNRANVKLVGTHAGIAIGEDGHSQMGLEDLGLMRGLPEMQVFQPADDQETREVVRYCVQNPGPAYLRLTRQKLVDIYDSSYKFQPGKWTTLVEGKNVAVIATGALVGSVKEANEKLGKPFTVVNACSIKPVDEALIRKLCETHSLIVTAEDHYTIGGLGSAVAEVMSSFETKARLHRIGVETFGESGSPEEIYAHYQFDAPGMAERLKKLAA